MGLKEPCTRSLRRLLLFKPCPFIQPNFLQGHTIPCRAHTTLKVPPQQTIQLDSILSKPLKTDKKRAFRLWTQYQTNKKTKCLSVDHYNVLMTALLDKACHGKKTGFWARLIQAYEEALTFGISPSPIMALAALKAYGASRDTLHVTSTYKDFRKRYITNPTSDGIYMTALLDCGQLPMAYRHLRDMERLSTLQLSHYLTQLIGQCMQRGMLPLALEIWKRWGNEEIEKESLLSITQSFWIGYTTQTITPLSFESFVQLYIQEKSNNTLYLFTMMDLIFSTSLIQPTHRTLHLLLEYGFKHGLDGKVISILSHMHEPSIETMTLLSKKFGPQPTYTAFIQSLQSQLDYPQLVKKMLAKGDEDKVMDWLKETSCKDLDCYAMVLEYWLNKGDHDDCIRAFDRLKHQEKGTVLNRRLVKAHLTALFSKGEGSKQINEIQIEFSSTTMTRILMNMIGQKTRTGQGIVSGKHVLTALHLMENQLNIQLSGEELGRIMSGLDVENGFRLYTWVREQKGERCASNSLYRAMMTSATKHNDVRKLERVWVDMQYRKRFLMKMENEKDEPTLRRYNVLLNGYASRLPKPDLTKVKKVFQRLLAQKVEPDRVTYNILIKSFVNANNMEAANQIFQKMRDSGIQPDTYSTNTLLNGWIIRKDWHHVETFVKELKTRTDQELDIVTFNLLVQSFLQLDSKTMNYTHLLKQQKKGSHLKEIIQTDNLSSQKIWSIFESTTGYGRNLKRTSDGFITLFSTQPDHVTAKLFMKAFMNRQDYASAAKIQKWMTLIPHK